MIEDLGIPATESAVREQLSLILRDPAFRSSRRSVQFLKYVVEKTLDGQAEQIKERTIGVDVFGRRPSYDTNEDHVVRTAAGELRKRLAIYYSDEKRRAELRMSLVPGSYIPQFAYPSHPLPDHVAGHETGEGAQYGSAHSHADHAESARVTANLPEAYAGTTAQDVVVKSTKRRSHRYAIYAAVAAAVLIGILGFRRLRPAGAQDLFWKPVLETPGPVLVAVGDVPNGPPVLSIPSEPQDFPVPVVQKTPSQIVPFGDAVTIARVVGALESKRKQVDIRREGAISYSDLRQGAVVLVGAFNNEWSLRLTRPQRFSLALDSDRHLIYIKDAKSPSSRNWSWATNLPREHQGSEGRPVLEDYALVSRIWNSDTGHVVIVIGGLYTYGTEAAGEFLTNPQLMQQVARTVPLTDPHRNLQIVLATTVTDDAAGPPRIVAISSE